MPSSKINSDEHEPLRCCVAGHPVGNTFYLASMQSEGADRAFIVCLRCIDRIDDNGTTKILVSRKKEK